MLAARICRHMTVSKLPLSTGSEHPTTLHAPVRVVDFRLRAQQLLLHLLASQCPPHHVPVLLGLQQWDQMDAAPHLLARQFTASLSAFTCPTSRERMTRRVLLLSDALAVSPQAVGADDADRDEVVGGAETLGREIPAVLDGVVAAAGGQILRHGGVQSSVYARKSVEGRRRRRESESQWVKLDV